MLSRESAERLKQPCAIAAAKSQFCPVIELDKIVSMKHGLKLANAIKIDERGAVDAQKFLWV